MAKKKYEDALPIEEVAIEETPVEEVIEEVIEEPKKAKTDVDAFINTQLTVINRMSNTAKARRVAERVLRNRKGK